MTVDEGRLGRPLKPHPGLRDGDPADGHPPQKPNQDGGFAGNLTRPDVPLTIHARDPRGVRLELRLRRHAPPGAEFVDRRHPQLLRPAQRQQSLVRFHLDLVNRGERLRPETGPFRDPADQPLVGQRVVGDLVAAAVREAARGLADEQAVRRVRREQATASALRHHREVVGLGVEAEHTQLEAVLPLSLAVAAARVAPGFREHGHDLLLERNRGRAGDSPHFDTRTRPQTVLDDQDVRLPLRKRFHQPRFGDADDARVRHFVPHPTGEVVRPGVVRHAGDEQLLSRLGAVQYHGFRAELEPEFGRIGRPRVHGNVQYAHRHREHTGVAAQQGHRSEQADHSGASICVGPVRGTGASRGVRGGQYVPVGSNSWGCQPPPAGSLHRLPGYAVRGKAQSARCYTLRTSTAM